MYDNSDVAALTVSAGLVVLSFSQLTFGGVSLGRILMVLLVLYCARMGGVSGGTVAGEHSVHFFGPMEEIEIRHRADSREIFARGALRAAAFAVGAEPGLYTVDDVLFGGL